MYVCMNNEHDRRIFAYEGRLFLNILFSKENCIIHFVLTLLVLIFNFVHMRYSHQQNTQ